MKNLRINKFKVLKNIGECKYYDGFITITNTLDKEVDLQDKEVYDFFGNIKIRAGESFVTVYFNKDNTVSFLAQGSNVIKSKEIIDKILENI